MLRSLGGAQGPGSRHAGAEARVKLAGICTAILSMLCLLAFAAGPAAAAGVTATTQPATNVQSQSAQLNGTYYNQMGATGYSYYFEYGTTTGYGQQTPQTPLPSGCCSGMDVAVSNLTPGTPYHFQLVLVAPDSTQTLGGDQSFTTMAPPASTPTVVTGPVSDVTLHGFTMTATINPEGHQTVNYRFETSAHSTSTGIPEGGGGVLTGGGFTPETVTFADPFVFDNAPRIFKAHSTRWIRPTPRVTLHYQAYVTADDRESLGAMGRGIGGGDRTVASLASTAQTTVSTGRATYTPVPRTPSFRRCGGSHIEASVELHGSFTTKHGTPAVAFEIGPTRRLGHYDAAGYEEEGPAGFPATVKAFLMLFVTDRCTGPSTGVDPLVVNPGQTLHYRIVADDGFGRGPALGRERTFHVPRG